MISRKTFTRHITKHRKSSKTPFLDDNSLEIFKFKSSIEEQFKDRDLSSINELVVAYDKREELRGVIKGIKGNREQV